MKNYDPRFMNLAFDQHNRYSVPYFWGTLGIIYNDKYVQPGSIQHWNDLWQRKYHNKIMLIDSARDVMGFALASMNQSMN
ncbi:extracellular solute-binding protein, partial [Streptococcus thermophilus]|nr:extracellular solute-binding protein [Streptococcus thermophilus]